MNAKKIHDILKYGLDSFIELNFNGFTLEYIKKNNPKIYLQNQKLRITHPDDFKSVFDTVYKEDSKEYWTRHLSPFPSAGWRLEPEINTCKVSLYFSGFAKQNGPSIDLILFSTRVRHEDLISPPMNRED